MIMIVMTFFSMILLGGSGWVKKKGQGYLKLNQFWVQTSGGYFNSDGVLDPMRMSSLFTSSLYGELGAGQKLSFEFYLPFYSRNELMISDDMGNISFEEGIGGFGDINLGLKQSLVEEESVALSLTYMVSIPTGITQGGTDGTLFTGDGDLNGLIKSDVGIPFGFGKIGGYVNANLGYNFRTQNFSDELWYGSELGLTAFESGFWLIARMMGISATQKGTTPGGIPFAGNVSFTNYSVEASMLLNKEIGISANYVGNISGSDVLITPAFNFGVFYEFR